ncbi:hypothetical protein EMIHUDRAFT_444688, partial [Emiliania huxleyi CCMP1516]
RGERRRWSQLGAARPAAAARARRRGRRLDRAGCGHAVRGRSAGATAAQPHQCLPHERPSPSAPLPSPTPFRPPRARRLARRHASDGALPTGGRAAGCASSSAASRAPSAAACASARSTRRRAGSRRTRGCPPARGSAAARPT